MRINTVLFDLDGTLINTNELIISSFLHTLNTYYPNQYKREDVLPFIGPSLHDTFSKIDESKVEEMITSYRKFNHDHHDIVGGQNAGTKTAAVSWTLKGRAYLEAYKPDFMLDKMSDLLPILSNMNRS
ncbi:HAD hydrolase-like protein [Bacillus thuringiensis]|uniref:HAD hydrolase-like protein n=1 Tax=Bacillus thuringiensis TaxID=1428 RepID=UPI0011A23419|nr:HAD hydrolase-like protein [Bacillus thuringiensis]